MSIGIQEIILIAFIAVFLIILAVVGRRIKRG
jgi:hypothetical protein